MISSSCKIGVNVVFIKKSLQKYGGKVWYFEILYILKQNNSH